MPVLISDGVPRELGGDSFGSRYAEADVGAGPGAGAPPLIICPVMAGETVWPDLRADRLVVAIPNRFGVVEDEAAARAAAERAGAELVIVGDPPVADEVAAAERLLKFMCQHRDVSRPFPGAHARRVTVVVPSDPDQVARAIAGAGVLALATTEAWLPGAVTIDVTPASRDAFSAALAAASAGA